MFSLDSVGIGGFGHDFGAVRGNTSPILEALDMFSNVKPSFAVILTFILGMVYTPAIKIPTERTRVMRKLSDGVRELAEELYRKSKEEGGKKSEEEEDSRVLSIVETLRKYPENWQW
jgi:hypothetical protein